MLIEMPGGGNGYLRIVPSPNVVQISISTVTEGEVVLPTGSKVSRSLMIGIEHVKDVPRKLAPGLMHP